MKSETFDRLQPDIPSLEKESSEKEPGFVKASILALSIISNPAISVDLPSKVLHETSSISSETLSYSYEVDHSEPIIELKTVAQIKARIASISKLEIV